ncbi:MAG: hypothetical protein AAFR62_21550, partial [Cyanobacteria bacterium J06629_2]
NSFRCTFDSKAEETVTKGVKGDKGNYGLSWGILALKLMKDTLTLAIIVTLNLVVIRSACFKH